MVMEMAILMLNEVKLRFKYRNREWLGLDEVYGIDNKDKETYEDI